jgi:hypothetical protein
MDLYETFNLNATASLVFYVEGNDFDNNFIVTDEYDKWYQETLNSDTLWCQFTDNDLTISNANYLIEMCFDYSYDIGMEMPYTIDGLLWMYGLYMEREIHDSLYESFETLMKEKQDRLG